MAKQVNEYYFAIEYLRKFLDYPNEALQDALDYAIVEYAKANRANEEDVEKAFRITLGADLKKKSNKVKNINRKQPHTHIGRNAFWAIEQRTRANHPSEPPTEEELIVNLAKLGLLSISGHRTEQELQTTKQQLFARMQGYASYKDIEKADERITKYNSRKNFERLKRLVEAISRIEFKNGHQRGIKFIVHIEPVTTGESEENQTPF